MLVFKYVSIIAPFMRDRTASQVSGIAVTCLQFLSFAAFLDCGGRGKNG